MKVELTNYSFLGTIRKVYENNLSNWVVLFIKTTQSFVSSYSVSCEHSANSLVAGIKRHRPTQDSPRWVSLNYYQAMLKITF